MPTVARIIARRLHDAGVRHAFGIPGGEVLTLIAALGEAGIGFVLTKHENAAGFMAEGVHHRTGAPAVLVATLGPGVANAIDVVANAQQDRVPLIFLTGCVDAAEAASYTHQIFDHRAVLRPLVKASFTAVPGAAAILIEKALAIATTDPWGPVHIDLPIRVAGMSEDDAAPARAEHGRAGPVPGPALERARVWLAEAERPLLLVGLEALQHGAESAVQEFARRFRMPVLTTYKAKGIIDEDDPLALGGAGLSPVADEILLPVVRRSDLVILAGYDPIEMRVGWRNPFGAAQRVIELAALPNTHDMHQAGLAFIGDVGAGLAALGAGIKPPLGWPRGEIAAARAALDRAFRSDEDWGPAAVVTGIRSVLPRDGVVTCDAGAHRILFSQVWRAHEPRSVLQSTGLCTMGCALPLAAGAKLADPARPVVCFTGDAGLEMVLGELATLRDLALPVVVVVFVDGQLALIDMKQRGSGLPNSAVDFGATDFAGVARAMGGAGYDVESRHTLADALRQALADTRFSVIACHIGRNAYDGRI